MCSRVLNSSIQYRAHDYTCSKIDSICSQELWPTDHRGCHMTKYVTDLIVFRKQKKINYYILIWWFHILLYIKLYRQNESYQIIKTPHFSTKNKAELWINPGVFHVSVMLEMYSCCIRQIVTCLQSLMSQAWTLKNESVLQNWSYYRYQGHSHKLFFVIIL
jgi:hypothetical protein